LPIVAYAVRDGARDPKRLPFLRALLPLASSLYEEPGQPYHDDVNLWTLLGKMQALVSTSRKSILARERLQQTDRLNYDLEKLEAAALNGAVALNLRDAHTGKHTLFPMEEE
jgi:hypothetical protein